MSANYLAGKIEGEKKGIEIGIIQEKIEMAKNCLEDDEYN
jgi:hypothetical protein